MGTVIVPFMKLKTDEDYEALVELAAKSIDFLAENGLEHERSGEMIERIGLVNFLEGIGVEVDPNMIADTAHQLLRAHGRLGRGSRRSGSTRKADSEGLISRRARPQMSHDTTTGADMSMQGQMRPPIESGCPDGMQYMHPLMLQELRQLDVPRPAAPGRAAPRRRTAATRSGPCAPAPSASSDVYTIRKLCDIVDKYADGHVRFTIRSTSSSWSPTETRSSR